MYNAAFSSVSNTDDGPWDPRAPCRKIITGWSINSQPTLNLFDTCCFSWMLVNLWYLTGFLTGYSKSWLMPLWNLPPVFSNSLRSLERSQLTGRWHMLFQCSRRVVRKTPVMTGLVSLISVPDKITEKFIVGVIEKTHKTQLSHWSETAQV